MGNRLLRPMDFANVFEAEPSQLSLLQGSARSDWKKEHEGVFCFLPSQVCMTPDNGMSDEKS